MTDMLEAQVVVRDADSSAAVVQAREAVQTGRPALARDVLVEHVSTTHDRSALALLGQVLYDLQDLPGAGAAWFGTTCRGAQVDEAVSAWRAAHHDDFGSLWRSLPKPVRMEPRLAKVEALRLKAFPGSARVTPAPSSVDQLVMSRGSASAQDRSNAAAPAGPAAPAAPAAVAGPAGADAPAAPAAVDRAPDAAAEVTSGRWELRSEHRSGANSRPGAERRRTPAPSSDAASQRPDRARSTHRASEDTVGGDPARIIAWVLATLFVFCAVVGAVTIIGWLLPG